MAQYFKSNELRLGNNLPLLRDRSVFPDESVDLIYLDPPLQPHRGSHVAAKEVAPAPYESIIPMATNIWRWDAESTERFNEIVHTGTPKLKAVVGALQTVLGHSAMFSYICNMVPRLQESWRILRKSGSIFIHGDPIASHYLKIIVDALFGQKALVNEIVWKRVESHKDVIHTGNYMGRIHDIILYYRKSDKSVFHMPTVAGSDDYVDHFFPHTDFQTGRRYRLGDVTTTRKPPHALYEWRIKRQEDQGKWMGDLNDDYLSPQEGWEYRLVEPYKGRHWALPKEMMTQAEHESMLVYSRTGYPHVKRYMPSAGIPVQDLWTDIAPVTGNDRLYASQKPRGLLDRIVAMASNPGCVVLDPFCGCGPTLEAVELANRQTPDEEPRVWIGIDNNMLAINLVRNRLGRFSQPAVQYKSFGEIKDLKQAELFAARHPLEFQYWAFSLIGARPLGGDKTRMSPDRPVDGVRFFKEKSMLKPATILVHVHIGSAKAEDIRGIMKFCDRTKAPMGVVICLQEPTRDAIAEAQSSGAYASEGFSRNFPRVQVASIEELLKDSRRSEHSCILLPPRYPGELLK